MNSCPIRQYNIKIMANCGTILFLTLWQRKAQKLSHQISINICIQELTNWKDILEKPQDIGFKSVIFRHFTFKKKKSLESYQNIHRLNQDLDVIRSSYLKVVKKLYKSYTISNLHSL